jgi:DNA invertase Pin-like site-specific DNA recombinase
MSGRAVLYLRVSSDRQVDNTSLSGQEDACRRWCRDNGITVDRVFTERGESAKTADRTEFQSMFRYLAESSKGRITHVVVYKFDRFSRSIDEGAPYRLALRKMGVSLSSASEPTDNTPAGRFLSSVLLAAAELDNDMRAERSTSGMKARLASGRWQWCPPTGYLRGSKTGPSLVIDPVQGPFVRRLFEMVASGESRGTALGKLTAQGFRLRRGGKLNQEAIKRLLSSPVYVGQVVGRSWGIVTKGDFEPLVSQKVYDRVQSVLAGKSPVAVPHS